jgi:glycine cleavage system T protein (aminomethyltransferase)
MAECAGWDMPVEYAGLVEEHLAVRTRAGLFDASHMGQVELAGRDALTAIQQMTSNDAAALTVGQTQRSALTTPAGGIVDDVLVFRLASDHFLLVVNASNVGKDVAWVLAQAAPFGDVAVVDTSSRYALLALQGPIAGDVLRSLTDLDLAGLAPEGFAHGEVAGVRATVSRTGDTGEDGYEVLMPPQSAVKVWQAVLEAGRGGGVAPAGLGARGTLQLEAATRVHGRDIDETTSVLEAGLERLLDWSKGEFTGRQALAGQRAAGVSRRLAGFEMADQGIAQRGDPAYAGGAKAGTVTTGAQAPFLKKAIGMVYLPIACTEPGTEFEVDVRGRRANARVVPMPFYTRPKG